tara:strand:- start:75 stop:182 length:108 start_codon:yes stop_codon:yes gene_type:complete
MKNWRWKIITILLYAIISMIWMSIWIVKEIVKLIL